MPRQKSDHVDSAAALAQRLRAARERAGLSQRQLALGICTPAYVSRLEKGERIPSLQLLRQLAERLGADADELAAGTAARPADPLLDAELALRLDELDEAERLFREALDVDAPRFRARATAGLGQIAFHRGEHRRAIELLEAARSRQPGDVVLLDSLGRAYAAVGDIGAATEIFERALGDANARNDPVDTLRFQVLLANALIDSGEYNRAEAVLADALALTEGSSDPIVRARLWWSQSRLHEAQGESNAAARYARLALETLETTEHTVYAARAHQLLAHVELDRGNADAALELLERGLPLIVQSGNRFERATFLLERARALAQLGHPEEAAAAAMESAALLADVSPGDAGRAYMLIGEVFEQLGDRDRAQELYELAVERMPLDNHHRSDAVTRLAGVLEAAGKKDEALDLLKRAVRGTVARPV
jgi:tetratricopeptide (TPR) repeat protein